jgi:predicted aconitase with swiveling domain
MFTLTATILLPGTAVGEALVLPEPLSLWGGLNPETGEIIDRRHPSVGQVVTGKVLVLPAGRGSSSASSILLEAVRLGTAPAAIITAEVDGILALGAAVAREMYAQSPPIFVLKPADYIQLQTGQWLTVDEEGVVRSK